MTFYDIKIPVIRKAVDNNTRQGRSPSLPHPAHLNCLSGEILKAGQ